mgnify:FL=1
MDEVVDEKFILDKIKKISNRDNVYRIIKTSAKEDKGIEMLTDSIKEMFFHGSISYNDEIYILYR